MESLRRDKWPGIHARTRSLMVCDQLAVESPFWRLALQEISFDFVEYGLFCYIEEKVKTRGMKRNLGPFILEVLLEGRYDLCYSYVGVEVP